MAGGYLGKISAVISANTGDYVRGLNEGAKATRDFAKTVQSTLNRSATEAARAFEGIYTPLQQFERAIRQAGALRLNFKGFEGAVRNINDLQKRLSGVLTNNEIDLVVKTSGLRDIQAVKDAINSLSKDEINLSAVAGGRSGLLRERERLRANNLGSTSIAGVDATVEQIDALIAKLDVLDDRKIDLIIDIVNQRGLDAAIEKARAFQDIAINVTKPLAAAVQTFGQLSGQVQAAFVPALKAAQQEAEKLQLSFSPARFESARKSVSSVVATINQLAEAQRLASSVPTGRELAFSDPRLNANLQAAARAGNSALALPASTIASDPQISGLVQQLRAVSDLAVAAGADLKAAFGTKDFAAASAEFDRLNTVLERIIQRINSKLKVQIDIEQAKKDAEEVARSIDGLKESLGADVAAPSRGLDRFRSDIISVKGTLDELPESVRATFIPAIREAEAEFLRLNALGPSATAEEIEAARRRLQELTDQAGIAATRLSAAQQILNSFGGRGVAGIEQGLNDKAAQGFVAQLQILQGVLASISGSAAPALVAAFDQVRAKVSQAAGDGTIRLQATRDEIERLIQALGAAAARAAGIDVTRLGNDLRRVGDVGRAGLDRFSLAVQQAGFAVDDFFSVTGNLDQRIRAVSNNITQLAFILGSTRGLWIGIGAVIATQAVLALRKWINEGRTAEDQTKALNDALVRQQSIVERLKQAFDSLGDAITRGTLSDAAERAKDVADSIAKITQARREFSSERVLESDPTVQRERANINRATRERDAASTFGARVAAQAQIDASNEIINRRRRGFEALPAPGDREVEDTIRRRATGPFRRDVPDLPEGNDLGALRARREALSPILDDLRTRMADAAADGSSGSFRLSILSESYAQIQNLAARLDAAISEIVDGPFPRLASAALEAGDSIRRAQDAAQEAVSAGIQGARGFLAQSNEAGRSLSQANQQLKDAIAIEDPAAREKALEAARLAIDSALNQASALDEQREAIADATAALGRFTTALAATVRTAESNLNAAEGRRDRAREEALGRPTPRNQRALDQAERDVERQEELRNNARLEARQAEERARQDPQTQAEERRIRQIDQLLQTTGVLAPGQREALIQEQENLRASAERRARQAVDNDPRVRDARDASIREEQRQQMVAEGRNLLLTDGQRARIELDNQIASVQAATGDRIAEAIREGRFNDIAAIQADQRRAEGRLREDAARQQAPTIFGLSDQVANAVLQGPSRAALAPTDVTTMEGSRELTRLLRGDDAARNQDLVNLQKEANNLLKVIANNPVPVAGP